MPSFESISYPSFEKLFRYGGDNFWTQGPTMARFDYNGLCLSFYKKIKIGSLILAILQQLKDSDVGLNLVLGLVTSLAMNKLD